MTKFSIGVISGFCQPPRLLCQNIFSIWSVKCLPNASVSASGFGWSCDGAARRTCKSDAYFRVKENRYKLVIGWPSASSSWSSSPWTICHCRNHVIPVAIWYHRRTVGYEWIWRARRHRAIFAVASPIQNCTTEYVVALNASACVDFLTHACTIAANKKNKIWFLSPLSEQHVNKVVKSLLLNDCVTVAFLIYLSSRQYLIAMRFFINKIGIQ